MGRGFPLRGTTSVVTGASSGIGAATAVALAARGSRVVVVARRADRLEHTVGRCRAAGGEAMAVPADVGDPAFASAVVTAAESAYGPVDVVVNNAGVPLHRNAADTTVDDVERVLNVNFLAAVRLTTAVLPRMLERRRGAVVNVGSVAGYLPNPREAAYAASKAALSMWTAGLAVDLGHRGVHAALVVPGPIDTEIWGHGQPYSGRRHPPELVADAVVAAVEKGRAHRTVPRRYAVAGTAYALVRGPMRAALRGYGRRTAPRAG